MRGKNGGVYEPQKMRTPNGPVWGCLGFVARATAVFSVLAGLVLGLFALGGSLLVGATVEQISTAPVAQAATAGLYVDISESYCNGTVSGYNIIIDPDDDGTLGADCSTITTTTNGPTGYSTTFGATAANLVCTAASGTYNLTPGPASLGSLSNNQWGYNIPDSTPDVQPTDWLAVPTVPVTVQSNSAPTTDDGDELTIWVGAQVDLTQPPCTYSGTIVLTASSNPIPALSVSSASPASGSTDGGDNIIITGNNFGTADNPYITDITIGGVDCQSFAVVNNTTANCVTPPNPAGTYDIVVVGFEGSVTLPQSFTQLVPVATVCAGGDATSANIQIDRDAQMFPVTFTGTSSSPSWAIADDTNWCSYSNRQWANAVTVTNPANYASAVPGTNVPESDVLGYWVYIPRYAYEVQRYYAFNAPAAAGNFAINFEPASATKKIPSDATATGGPAACYTAPTGTSFTAQNYLTACGVDRTYGAATGTTWATHPAFTFGGSELNGIWMGKFETSGTRTAPQVKPNQQTNIGEYPTTYFDMGKAMGVADANATGGNSTGVTQNSHSLSVFKTRAAMNEDWGAAAYLSASAYGAGYSSVQPNAAFYPASVLTGAGNNRDADGDSGTTGYSNPAWSIAGITGCGPSSSGSTSNYTGGGTINTSTLQNTAGCDGTANGTHNYQNTLGVLASTTNNVYGVYDMSGGAYEFVMANLGNSLDQAGGTMPAVAYLNPFAIPPFAYNSTTGRPAWSASSSAQYFNFDICTWATCGGQALHETNTAQSVNGNSSSWNSVYSTFPGANSNGNSIYVGTGHWVLRGGMPNDSGSMGIFSITADTGYKKSFEGFRAVLWGLGH